MPKPSGWADIELADAGAAPVATVLSLLGSSLEGLQEAEAARRLSLAGPNSIGTHRVRGLAVFGRQLKNPLLILLVTAASVSFWVGEKTDALLILGIIALSVGLGFYNEYRSEKAAAELHDRIRHRTVAVRGSQLRAVDATELVPGDVVQLDVGDVVPADLRLLEVHSLECDESILTGEAMPTAKTSEASPAGSSLLDLDACAFMGTVVRGGTGRAVVVRTGGRTAFGTIARELTQGTAQTAFQMGLRDFSLLLVYVTVALCVSIFVINALLRHPLLESALFALAIAVGLTPQLLPAIVTVSLAFGAKQMARRSVLVKRLVSIEDLGNMEVLFTDKTGTLTEGQISFVQACDAAGRPSDEVLRLGLLCTSAAVQDGHVVGGNPLDRALWDSAAARRQQKLPQHRLAELPFDYERRLMSVLIRSPEGALELVTKGAPEEVLARCDAVPSAARDWLDAQFEAGGRVVAVGHKAGARGHRARPFAGARAAVGRLPGLHGSSQGRGAAGTGAAASPGGHREGDHRRQPARGAQGLHRPGHESRGSSRRQRSRGHDRRAAGPGAARYYDLRPGHPGTESSDRQDAAEPGDRRRLHG